MIRSVFAPQPHATRRFAPTLTALEGREAPALLTTAAAFPSPVIAGVQPAEADAVAKVTTHDISITVKVSKASP